MSNSVNSSPYTLKPHQLRRSDACGVDQLARRSVFVVLFALPSIVAAQNAAWVNPSGGVYGVASNWVPSIVPGPSSDVLINVGASYNIAFQSDHSAASLSLANNLDLTFSSQGPGDSAHTFSMNGAAEIDRAKLTLGDLTQGRPLHMDVNGRLNMQGGQLSLLNGAQFSSQTGLTNSNSIDGAGGAQSLIVVSGVDADGEPSRWQSGGGTNLGGSGGPAILAVLGGGEVSTAGTLSIGADAMADGSAIEVRGTSASGAPSSLTSNTLRLGFAGIGGDLSRATAQVTAGGSLSTGSAALRKDSFIIIDGEDANLNPSQWQAAGSVSTTGGFVEVTDGGYLSSDFVTLSGLAIARVNGVGASGRPSRWDVNGSIFLGGASGFGSMLIDSGHVTSLAAEIGVGTGNSLLSVEGGAGAGGVWENSGDVFVGGSDTGPQASGDLRLNDEHARIDIGGALTVWGTGAVTHNGGHISVDTVNHTAGGTFAFNAGTLSVNRFEGNLVNPGGTLSPGVGAETGATLIVGDYSQQSGGTLAIDIGGAGAGSTHDLVNISGAAQIDGLLQLSLNNGFAPDAGDEFTVLAANSLFGFFDNVINGQRLDTADGLGSFVVNYGIGSAFDEARIVLSDFQSAATIPGDYNNDGIVDAVDYAIWRENLGNPVTLPGDPTPGSVTHADFEVWRANFGSGLAPVITTNALPEISTIWLTMIIGSVVITSRRRQSA